MNYRTFNEYMGHIVKQRRKRLNKLFVMVEFTSES